MRTAIWAILGLWAILLVGCGGGAAEPKQNPKPVGKPERPLKPEHKEAYIAMIKQRSNARFPDLDASGFLNAFQAKVKTYQQMVALFGKPDEIRIVNKWLDEKVRETDNNIRIAVYHNMVFEGGVVQSYYFDTGETNSTTRPLQQLEQAQVDFGGVVAGVFYDAE